jgi:hypothetical protein
LSICTSAYTTFEVVGNRQPETAALNVSGDRSRLAWASSGKLLQHMLRKNATAIESGAISHEFGEDLLSVAADQGYVRQVDD